MEQVHAELVRIATEKDTVRKGATPSGTCQREPQQQLRQQRRARSKTGS